MCHQIAFQINTIFISTNVDKLDSLILANCVVNFTVSVLFYIMQTEYTVQYTAATFVTFT